MTGETAQRVGFQKGQGGKIVLAVSFGPSSTDKKIRER